MRMCRAGARYIAAVTKTTSWAPECHLFPKEPENRRGPKGIEEVPGLTWAFDICSSNADIQEG